MCAEVNNGRAHKTISMEILVVARRSCRWRVRRPATNDDRLASAAELCAKITDVRWRTDVDELIHTPKDVCRRWRHAVRRKRGEKKNNNHNINNNKTCPSQGHRPVLLSEREHESPPPPPPPPRVLQ